MKSRLQLIIKGKPVYIPVTLTEEQLKQLTAAINLDDARVGWGQPQIGQTGYYENELNEVVGFDITPDQEDFAHQLHDNANFFTDEEVAETIIRADTLLRKLRQYAVTNRTSSMDFSREGGYTITYNYIDQCLECGATGNWLALGDVVFESEEMARQAMNEFSSELIWYFTYAKQRF